MNLWNTSDAESLIAWLEPEARKRGYHVALTGSVLYKGESNKDIDIILYPHTTEKQIDHMDLLKLLGLSFVRECFHEYDAKEVYECSINNKRIDIFFMQ